jgi:hypothetical protein
MTVLLILLVPVEDKRIYDKGEYYDNEDKFFDPQRNVSEDKMIKEINIGIFSCYSPHLLSRYSLPKYSHFIL